MPRWNDGLVNAFPVPEDRRPGYKKKRKARYETEEVQDPIGTQTEKVHTLEDALAHLSITAPDSAVLTTPTEPFRFLDLPSELRNRIYHDLLFSHPGYRDATGERPSRLSALTANKQMHEEATHILYSTTRFNIFPIQLFDGPPTVLDLPTRYLPHIANLKMTIGPSWTNVPKSWKVTRSLERCLKRLDQIQTLRVFIEFDPTHPAFAKFRISYDFYTDFCGDLLKNVLQAMPQLHCVELDGNPGVLVSGPLVSRVKAVADQAEKEVRWGRQAGWAHKHEFGSTMK